MKFIVRWNIEGFRGRPLEAGDEIEATLKEVKELVARDYGGAVENCDDACLTPLDRAEGTEALRRLRRLKARRDQIRADGESISSGQVQALLADEDAALHEEKVNAKKREIKHEQGRVISSEQANDYLLADAATL